MPCYDKKEKLNIGCDGMYLPVTREEIIAFSKQPGLRRADYFDAQYPNTPKIKCVIVANYHGWVTAVTDNNSIIQEWAGKFYLG